MTVAPAVTVDETTEETNTEDGDHLAHIINPTKNLHCWMPPMTSRDVVRVAQEYNIEIIALCGHKFIPSRDPERYPACRACFAIAGILMREGGE